MRSGEIVEVATGDEYDERFPQTAALRQQQRIHSVIAVPLLDTDGTVLGGVVAASRRPGWLVPRMRPVVTGIAEQSGVALERARLRSVDDEARRRADILQRLVAALSAAALPTEVAEAAVPYLFEAFGASLATVGVAAGGDVRTLKVPARATADDWEWRPVPISTSTPTADAMRAKRVIELHGRERIRELYPPDVERLLAGHRLHARRPAAPSDGRRRGRVRGEPQLRPRRARDARCDRRRAHPGARALGSARAGAGRTPARRADGAQCVAAGGGDHGLGRGERDRGGVPGARGGRRVRVGARHRVAARAPGRVRGTRADAGSVRGVSARARRAGLGGDGDRAAGHGRERRGVRHSVSGAQPRAGATGGPVPRRRAPTGCERASGRGDLRGSESAALARPRPFPAPARCGRADRRGARTGEAVRDRARGAPPRTSSSSGTRRISPPP